MKIKQLSLLFLLLLLTIPSAVFAAPALEKRVISADETINDDIIQTDDLDIEIGAEVNGDLILWGGTAHIDGILNGDIVAYGGDVIFGETSTFNGDCLVIGGDAPENLCSGFGAVDTVFGDSVPFQIDWEDDWDDSETTIFGTIVSSLGLGLIALIAFSAAPTQMSRIGDAISSKPVASGAIGLLTLVSTLAIVAVLIVLSALLLFICIGAFGIPIILALFAILGIAALVGWVAVGQLFGEFLAGLLKRYKMRPVATAVFGTIALSILLGLLTLLLGEGASSFASTVITCIGLGATALTRFGTRTYPLYVADPGKVEDAINNMP